MPHKRLETLGTHGELFERFLLEAEPSEFEEFLAKAPQLLRKKSLEFLRDCKARVDARLAAEPETNVVHTTDAHEIRVCYWQKISYRLEAEINWRTGKSSKAKAHSIPPKGRHDYEVGKRRSIVKDNRNKSALELCKLFDFSQVPLPDGWEDTFSVATWLDAYHNPKLNHRIQALISRDRSATAKSQ